MDNLLIILRKLTVNPERSYAVREAASDVRNIPASEDAERIVLNAVAEHLTRYADSMDEQSRIDSAR